MRAGLSGTGPWSHQLAGFGLGFSHQPPHVFLDGTVERAGQPPPPDCLYSASSYQPEVMAGPQAESRCASACLIRNGSASIGVIAYPSVRLVACVDLTANLMILSSDHGPYTRGRQVVVEFNPTELANY